MRPARALFGVVAPLVAAAALLGACERRARADDGPPRAATSTGRVAQALFDDARTLMDAGKYAEACPKLAESQRLDPGGGTLLNLAVCYEKLGATATAWATYGDALSAAIADRRPERETYARDKIRELSPRLARLRVEMPPKDRPWEVAFEFDGESLPKAALDAPVPVDPGPHTLVVRAPGKVAFREVFEIAPSETRSIHVPPLEGEGASGSGVAGAGGGLGTSGVARNAEPGGAQAQPRLVPVRTSNTALNAARATSWTVFSLGLVAGVSLMPVAYANHENAKRACNFERAYCRDDGAADAKRARTFAWIGTASFIAAGVGLVTAIALPSSRSTITYRVAVVPAPDGAAASLGGSF